MRYGKISLYLGLLMWILAACAPQIHPTPTPTAPSQAFTVRDDLGRDVTFPAPPQRIVITGKALFAIADAAYIFPAAKEKIVGMGKAWQGTSNFIRYVDPNYKEKVNLRSDAGAEQIAALHPDAVLLKSFLADRVGKSIEALGIPVVYLDLETPEQYERDLMTLGKIFDDEARAAQVVDFYRSKVEAVEKRVEGAPKPRVLLIYYREKNGNVSFNVPPASWIQTSMVKMAGGEPVWTQANLGKGWTQVTLEQIAAWDPDYIFVISYARPSEEAVAKLKADPNWQNLRALREGHVLPFAHDFYSWDQPDTRWILGLTWLAGKLHPERFPDLDIQAEVKTFYKTLYGLDEAFVEKNFEIYAP